MEELGQKTEYLKILKAFLLEEEDYKRKVQMIQKAKEFCQYLTQNNIDYEVCLKHAEVISCDDSYQYYQRFQDYLTEDYVICKNLLVQERKGEKRKFLVILDSRKQLSFQQLREILACKKLEFVNSNEMKELLDTTPGNVSLFNIKNDQTKQVHLVLDQELLQANLLAFHPLYNGMSLFLRPIDCLKFVHLIKRNAQVISLSKENNKQYIKSN